STRWCARAYVPSGTPSSGPLCTSTYRMPRPSASRSNAGSRAARTPSAPSQAPSSGASAQPSDWNVRSEVSTGSALAPPTITSGTSDQLLEADGDPLGNTELDDLLDRRFSDSRQAPERAHEQPLTRGPDALYRVKRRGERFASARPAMMG